MANGYKEIKLRSDMSKVIVERPRLGGKYARKGREVQDPDLLISHEGMLVPYVKGYNNKELNENLAPLLRFLGSRVGQPWDQVWSEISENIRASNPVQQHVRDHVMGYVVTQTWSNEQGELWGHVRGPVLLNSSYVRFYVHPVSGILCANSQYLSWKKNYKIRKQETERERASRERVGNDGTQLRKKDGIWYAVEIRDIPPVSYEQVTPKVGQPYKRQMGGTAYDVILDATVSITHNQVWNLTTREFVYGPATYCASKRQLNHTELKKYRVSND